MTDAAIDCCSSARSLRGVIEGAAAVVLVRVLPVPSMFPDELSRATATLPFEVRCAVTPPSVAEAVGVSGPRLGEVLLFSSGRLIGRIAPEIADKRDRLLGLFKAGLAPWLGRAGFDPTRDEYDIETDPF